MIAATTTSEQLLENAVRFLSCCGPWAAELVLIGGHAPLFYRKLWGEEAHPPRLTRDLDIAAPATLAPGAQGSLLSHLRQNDQIVVVPRRGAAMETVAFQWAAACTNDAQRRGEQLAPDYVEFIAPLRGSAVQRGGTSGSPVMIAPGLSVEALRYVDLLLQGPVSYHWSSPDGEDYLQCRIAHPTPFLLQKALIPSPRRKDWWYMWDVATVVPADVAAQWLVDRDPPLTPEYLRWIQRAIDTVQSSFCDANARGVVGTLAELSDLEPDAIRPAGEMIARTVRTWVGELHRAMA